MSNIYLQQVYQNLPRILAMYDTDSTSDTYGFGDRYYWGWKLIDFPNGTFQAAASGFAGLVVADLLPEGCSKSGILARIDAIFRAAGRMAGPRGSLDEAFPNEASFCVTGLVAGDLLLAAERLKGVVARQMFDDWIDIVRPMIDFLHIQDEYHGVISNHLATNALALVRWSDVTGENVDVRARLWVDRILSNQSSEGWFREYDGADPGYQTWCTSSLAAIHKLRPQWGLSAPLKQSLKFISYAAHPDGSFGGLYGSRMTRFVFPAGLEILSGESEEASALADFSCKGIVARTLVSMDAIDPSNLIPFFNDYVTAALMLNDNSGQRCSSLLPCFGPAFRKEFTDCGWLIDRGVGHYSLLNLKRGGAGLHCVEGGATKEICAFVARDARGCLYSSQFVDHGASWVVRSESYLLKASVRKVSRPRPDAFRFVVLRLLCLSVFRSVAIGNWIKRALVKYVITGKVRSVAVVERSIHLGGDLVVTDVSDSFLEPIEAAGFKSTHMASMGYWQEGD